MQEIKYLITLGVIMFGLCQYNKTDLAWIFLIFPIIYSVIQNGILYIHVSSAIQNAPQEYRPVVNQSYGTGMNAPLIGQGPPKPELTAQPPTVPAVSSGGFDHFKPSNNQGGPLNNASFGSLSM